MEKNVINKVTTKRLDMVLRMVGIQLNEQLIDRIIDCVVLIEKKGCKASLKDVCKLEAKWLEHEKNS